MAFRFRRGLRANVPSTGMLVGQSFFSTDRKTLHVATDATTKHAIVPPIDELQTVAAINGAADLILIHDADAVGVKEGKVTFDAFKTALNIPPGSADEKVAVVAGGTAGYVWGTDGTNGVIRMGSSMSWVKDGASGFVTLSVGDIDGGTF